VIVRLMSINAASVSNAHVVNHTLKTQPTHQAALLSQALQQVEEGLEI
jgi:hypothetical protein